MVRYDRQTKPGLVALYDIRPGNGAGPFLQPRSPHGARSCMVFGLKHKGMHVVNKILYSVVHWSQLMYIHRAIRLGPNLGIGSFEINSS